MTIKLKRPEEDIEDEIDDKSFTYNLYGPVSKGVTSNEADKLREEMLSMRSENREILEQLKEMKLKNIQDSESKFEYEKSLKEEIRMLQSRIDPQETVQFDMESEIRSNFATDIGGYKDDRESLAKPLSEYADSQTDNYTIDRNIVRKRKYM